MNTTAINKQNLITEFGNSTPLKVVFEKIHLQWQERGEVVCQFRINGMNLTEADEGRLAQATLEEVQTFEVDSQRPDDLLQAVLQNWVNELPTLITNADQLAQEIRFEGIEGKLSSFVNLVDTCQFLIDSLLTLGGVVQTQAWTQGEQWVENEKLTARAIGEALAAFEKKDFTLLAEVVEYDLGHSLQVWLELLKGFLQKVIDERTKDPRVGDRLFKKDPLPEES